MKVFHAADLHYSQKNLTWVDKAMSNAVGVAIKERCKIGVIAGDSFDHALSVHEPAFAAYVRHVLNLAAYMPVAVLQGTHSHDRPGSLDILADLPTQHGITVLDDVGTYPVGPAMLLSLPSLNKADPAIMAEGPRAWVNRTLSGMARHAAMARDQGAPTILVTHGTVTGCTTESGYAMVSPDHEFSVEDLARAECDAVMLGHIHRHQSWRGVLTPAGNRTTIAYPGSLARLVHGHHDPVGFLIWDIEPGRAEFAFHPSPARQLLEITFSGPPSIEELRELARTVTPDDAVRIRYEIDEERATSVDKALIRELFAGAETVKIEARVLPVQRVRAAGIGRAATLAEKLGYWCTTTDSGQEHERLAQKLDLLMSQDVEQITSRLIDGDAHANNTRLEAA